MAIDSVRITVCWFLRP